MPRSLADRDGLSYLAEIKGHATHSQEPQWFTTAPIPAIRKLLDKVGSGQDLLAYAQTDAGRQTLESLKVERHSPHARIIGALQTSIVMICLGAAFLFLRGRITGTEEGFLVFGVLATMLGIGFGLSAIASYYLSKSFGLLNGGRA